MKLCGFAQSAVRVSRLGFARSVRLAPDIVPGSNLVLVPVVYGYWLSWYDPRRALLGLGCVVLCFGCIG